MYLLATRVIDERLAILATQAEFVTRDDGNDGRLPSAAAAAAELNSTTVLSTLPPNF